jgi:hypothetical protein
MGASSLGSGKAKHEQQGQINQVFHEEGAARNRHRLEGYFSSSSLMGSMRGTKVNISAQATR